MKKLFCIAAAAFSLCLLTGCSNPNSIQMDLYQGYGENLKLIHLNASSGEKRERMEAFLQVIENAEPLEKDLSLFAYYPDYKLELEGAEGFSGAITAIIDVNGDYIDFYYPGPYPERSDAIYRSRTTAQEFTELVHQA